MGTQTSVAFEILSRSAKDCVGAEQNDRILEHFKRIGEEKNLESVRELRSFFGN